MERKFFLLHIVTLASTFSVFPCEITLDNGFKMIVEFDPGFDRHYFRSDVTLRAELQNAYIIERAMKIRDSDYQAKCASLLTAGMLGLYVSSRIGNYQLLKIDRTCYEAGCIAGCVIGWVSFLNAHQKRKLFIQLQSRLSEQQLDNAILKLGITNSVARIGAREPR